MTHILTGPNLSGYSTEELEKLLPVAETPGEVERLRSELERRYGAYYDNLIDSIAAKPITQGGHVSTGSGGPSCDTKQEELKRRLRERFGYVAGQAQPIPPPLPGPRTAPPPPQPEPNVARPTPPAPAAKSAETSWGWVLWVIIACIVFFMLFG